MPVLGNQSKKSYVYILTGDFVRSHTGVFQVEPAASQKVNLDGAVCRAVEVGSSSKRESIKGKLSGSDQLRLNFRVRMSPSEISLAVRETEQFRANLMKLT